MNQGPSCSMIAVNSFVIVGVGINAAYSRAEKNTRGVCLANGLGMSRGAFSAPLAPCADVPLNREVREEGLNLHPAEFPGMP